MFTSDFTSAAATDAVGRVPRPDTECRARARDFLVGVLGARPDALTWDHTHRLQGHAHLGGRELVVIAPRDDAHSTVVLTTQDWDQVRLSDGAQRRSLLGAYAIGDRRQLAAVLANHCPMATAA
jgi:hypothetical protein